MTAQCPRSAMEKQQSGGVSDMMKFMFLSIRHGIGHAGFILKIGAYPLYVFTS